MSGPLRSILTVVPSPALVASGPAMRSAWSDSGSRERARRRPEEIAGHSRPAPICGI